MLDSHDVTVLFDDITALCGEELNYLRLVHKTKNTPPKSYYKDGRKMVRNYSGNSEIAREKAKKDKAEVQKALKNICLVY